MPILDRPEGHLWYDVTDVVPPWTRPKQTVLFLNGLAVDSDIWVTWLPELAGRFRIVRTDLRGFGRSFVPESGAPWSVQLIARDVLDVMAAVGVEKVHFVGESTGGTVGLHMAASHPGRLASLTTVSAAHRGGEIRRAQELVAELATLGMAGWSEKLMPLRFHAGTLAEPMWRWFRDVQAGSVMHACADLVRMLVAVDLTADLPSIRVPTLILAPDDSPFVRVEQQLERLRAIAGSELHVVAGARHGVAHSHGVHCARVLADFIDRRAAAAAA